MREGVHMVNKLIVFIALFCAIVSLPLNANNQKNAEALKELTTGQALLKKGQILAAQKHLAKSLDYLDTKDPFQRNMKLKVQALIKESKARQEKYLKQKRIEQYKIAAQLANHDMERRQKLFSLRRDSLVEKMELHLQNREYKAAENLGREILNLDPKNKRVKQTMTFAQTEAIKQAKTSIVQRKVNGQANQKLFDAKNYIIQANTVEFSKDFREVTEKRKRESDKTKKEESWRTRLRGKLNETVKYNFEAVPVSEVIKKMEIAYDVAIVVDKDAWREALGEGEVLVDLQATRLTLKTALYWIFQPFDLKVGLKYGTIYIAPSENLKDETVVKAYDIRDLVMVIKDYKAVGMTLGDDGEGMIVTEEEPEYDGFDADGIIEILESIIANLDKYE